MLVCLIIQHLQLQIMRRYTGEFANSFNKNTKKPWLSRGESFQRAEICYKTVESYMNTDLIDYLIYTKRGMLLSVIIK